MAWTIADAPDQSGRVAVVTGASGGLGLETARALAARGATVVATCRNVAKLDTRDSFQVVRLDLASLASVREAAETIRASCARLDLLINNAGVMTIPFG